MVANNKIDDPISVRILQAAHLLSIQNGGIFNVKMYQISKTAGIGQASLYRRFKNINEIFLCFCQDDFSLLQAKIADFNATHSDSADKISNYFDCFIDFTEKGYQHGGVEAIKNAPSTFDFHQTPVYAYLSTTLLNLLTAHFSNLADDEVKFIAHTLLSLIDIANYAYLRLDGYDSATIRDKFFTVYLNPLLQL